MKNFLKLITVVLSIGLMLGCKTYRSIENVTVKSDPNLTKVENLHRQLDKVSSQEKIQVKMLNGRIHNLLYQSHSKDSLFTKIENVSEYNLNERSSAPIHLGLNEIEKLYVWRTNHLITFGIPSAILIGMGIIISTAEFGPDMSGFTWNGVEPPTN